MNHEIVESFSGLVRDKSIDKDILAGIVEDIFGMMVRKKYGLDAKFDVVVNMDKGDIEIYLERQIVDIVENRRDRRRHMRTSTKALRRRSLRYCCAAMSSRSSISRRST